MKVVTMLFIAAVGLLYASNVKGQTAFGVKAGVDISSLSANEDAKSRISPHGGIFVHRTLNKYWCVQPELLYSGEGLKLRVNGGETTWALSYIQIPVMIQFYPTKQVYIDFGPQVGLLIGAKENPKGGIERDIKTLFSTAQFGIGLGAGIKATDNVIIYGRYNFGLTDVADYDATVQRSKVGQVGIAYRFD